MGKFACCDFKAGYSRRYEILADSKNVGKPPSGGQPRIKSGRRVAGGITRLPVGRFITWLGLKPSKFYSWKDRFGKINEHNAWIPGDHWLDDTETQAILDSEAQHPLEGYRRLAFRMLDADVAAASPIDNPFAMYFNTK